MCLKLGTHIPWIHGIQAESTMVHLLCPFSPIRMQWITLMLLTCHGWSAPQTHSSFLRHGLAFLQDPSKIDDSNHEVWCNLHITPALEGIIVEVCSLEEVTHWAKKEHLGSAPDLTEPRVANLIVALGNNPLPCTLSLARVHVAPNQKMCSLIKAVESAKEHFNREKGLEAAHYYLTPVYTEAPYILSDAGLQGADGTATIIGVAALGVNPKDNAVNLSVSEGATSTLVIHCLLHLTMSLILIPPQLSHPAWTGMRRAKI